MSRLLLIRHGQARWGSEDYDRLSDRGVEQSRVLGQALRDRGVKPQRVICGTMLRHRQTAQHCLEAMGLDGSWEEVPAWNEFDHEEVIARHRPEFVDRAAMAAELAQSPDPRQAFSQMFRAALERWMDRQQDGYSEPWSTFVDRVSNGLDTTLDANEGTTLVFTSGGPISRVVCRLWELPDPLWLRINPMVNNASITQVIDGRRGRHLVSFNEHGHLDGAGLRTAR